jgi:hypothetical protein
MNDRVIAALIGAIVVAVGWLFNSRRERQQSRARRRERVVDIQKAIRAEIKALVEAPQNRDLSGSLERGMARFDAETPEEPYVPFIPHEKHDTVFQALVGDVHLLPTETVEPVILYYNQTVAIGMMAHDLRSEKFAALDVEALYGNEDRGDADGTHSDRGARRQYLSPGRGLIERVGPGGAVDRRLGFPGIGHGSLVSSFHVRV